MTLTDVHVGHENLDYRSLNAMLNMYDANGKIQFDKDREAAKEYFKQHVNPNTVFSHSLREKLDRLFEEKYYEREVFDQYDYESEVKPLYKMVYDKKFRFPTYYGAFKFFNSYALKTFDGARYLERYEDRVAATALYLGRGDIELARGIAEAMITGQYQPATPTFLNAGKRQRGELVSCFLIRTEDNMESIARNINAVLQLSKRGGGVAVSLTNLREAGAPIKLVEDQSSGVIPVAKMIEQAVTYSNQLGQRDGSAAVYLSVHHPDVLTLLDSKRENADARIRLNRLSIGLVMTDVVMQAFREGKEFYTFSPYDIEREYGKPMTDISITDEYENLIANDKIKKTMIDARKFLKIIAEVQFESGYPYIMFEDTVNRVNNIYGRISMSNLCSEILQVSTPSQFNENLDFAETGKDISCNLGSLNIAKVMQNGSEGKFGKTINSAVRALTAVSDLSNISSVPSIERGNDRSHAIGLGQMNLAGFLASEGIMYGSPESIDFVSAYFAAVTYHAILASNEIAIDKGETFEGFDQSKYATGEAFQKYVDRSWAPEDEKAIALFEKYGIELPTQEDWAGLRDQVIAFGLYNQNLQAVPPTGSISYINHSTASIHPIVSKIEIRKEGKGRAYYPAYGMTEENQEFYVDAYEVGAKKLIDVYAAATEHVDQGLSCTLFFTDKATTKDINMAQMYAWRKGLKTIYYIRLRQDVLAGTEVEGCISCSL